MKEPRFKYGSMILLFALHHTAFNKKNKVILLRGWWGAKMRERERETDRGWQPKDTNKSSSNGQEG